MITFFYFTFNFDDNFIDYQTVSRKIDYVRCLRVLRLPSLNHIVK